jgi:hypothetical protein
MGFGAVTMSLLGRSDDIVTTGITTAVVMVVAAISPEQAWKQPILRVVDTIVGAATGVAGAWISRMQDSAGASLSRGDGFRNAR